MHVDDGKLSHARIRVTVVVDINSHPCTRHCIGAASRPSSDAQLSQRPVNMNQNRAITSHSRWWPVSVSNFNQIPNIPLLLIQPAIRLPHCQAALINSQKIVGGNNEKPQDFYKSIIRGNIPTPSVLAWKHVTGDRYRGKCSYNHMH